MKKGAAPDKAAMMTDRDGLLRRPVRLKSYATCNAMMKTRDAQKKEVME